ncbi:MFS transporter [Streptomyces sp. NPDC058206]|uniref:MFS transporter n=1 Tax=Streptomyces sp. NPDC058206 TaxID=3346382 RepID=UPI0036E3893F
MTQVRQPDRAAAPEVASRDGSDRLPLARLLALSTAAFLTIMTEALPAGILPAMSSGLGITESAAGQTVTVYAIGSFVAAIPLTAATTGWHRKRLLLLALAGFVVANTVTAASDVFAATLVARFIGGVVAGLLWALMAGYARRMVAPHQRGRATATALAGTPVALSIGVPAGTFLANLVGWRYTFGIMTALTLALIVWVIAIVPDFPGQTRQARMSLRRAAALPGAEDSLTSPPRTGGTPVTARWDTRAVLATVAHLAGSRPPRPRPRPALLLRPAVQPRRTHPSRMTGPDGYRLTAATAS